MAGRGRSSAFGDPPHLSIAQALPAVRQKVRIAGVIVDKSPGKRSSGTDYHCSVRIVDTSEYKTGILVNLFAETLDNLPQIEMVGDIITLSCVEIKAFNGKVNAVFNKRTSAFAIYEGKYAQKVAPYHCSPNYHTHEEDKQVVDALWNWLNNAQFDTVSNVSFLRYLCEGKPVVLVCKILHVHEVNQDDLLLFIWDGTDAPPCLINEKLDNEEEFPLPLQPEVERLSMDIICKFPTVGTVLRVQIDRRIWKMDTSFLLVDRWIYLIHLAVGVHAGLWYGTFEPCTRVRHVPNEDSNVVKCLSNSGDRLSSQWGRMPFVGHIWSSTITETENEDIGLVTLMDIIKHPHDNGKFRSVVRVMAMLPSNPIDFLTPRGDYSVRLTLEDPTTRIHAYLYQEDAEKFFGGYPGIERLANMRNKLLGISSEGAEDGPRNPEWLLCCIKSFYHQDIAPGKRLFGILDNSLFVLHDVLLSEKLSNQREYLVAAEDDRVQGKTDAGGTTAGAFREDGCT
ncbi:hypothetical protein V2J09_002225 [Rumex salicifolius]